ncbi:hypothetical protein OROMI_002439 [Orobanche minor]
MGSSITDDPAFRALQKSVQGQADKIENLSVAVASLTTMQNAQAVILSNLEKLLKEHLIAQGKTPATETTSGAVHQPKEHSTIAPE